MDQCPPGTGTAPTWPATIALVGALTSIVYGVIAGWGEDKSMLRSILRGVGGAVALLAVAAAYTLWAITTCWPKS